MFRYISSQIWKFIVKFKMSKRDFINFNYWCNLEEHKRRNLEVWKCRARAVWSVHLTDTCTRCLSEMYNMTESKYLKSLQILCFKYTKTLEWRMDDDNQNVTMILLSSHCSPLNHEVPKKIPPIELYHIPILSARLHWKFYS